MEAICNVPILRKVFEEQLRASKGLAPFRALFDLNGRLVPSRPDGTSWALLSEDGTIMGWFNASRARNPEVRIRHNAKKGFYVGVILASAKIEVLGPTPLTQRVAIVRSDPLDFRNVIVMDNGRQLTRRLITGQHL